MNQAAFNELYNDQNKCRATYRDEHGHKIKGLILDGIVTGVSGRKFIFVNTMYSRLMIEDIINVEDTGMRWVA